MSGILRLESLTKGNTLKQGDKTPLKYRLFDADGEKLNIAGKSAVARLMYPDFLRAGYESETLTVSPDNTVTFSIDKVIKPVLYYVEITVDDKYIFPSRVDESKINIDKSSKGSDVAIIEIIGKDILIRDVREQVETEIKPVVDDMIIANQKVLENEKIVQDVNSLAQQLENRQDQVEQFNNQVITEMTDKDVISAPEILGARGAFDTLGERLNDTAAQLEQTTSRTQISPDDFEGTDIEKIQQAFDYAVINNIAIIELTRTYDLTGGSIMFPASSYFDFRHIIFRGGTIVKNDSGFVFDSLADNNSRNSPKFENTIFKTTADGCYLFNGDKSIRQNVTNCTFYKMGFVLSTGYLQTIRVDNCETAALGCDFVKASMVYDGAFINHRGEANGSSFHLVNIQNVSGGIGVSTFGFRFINSLVEGYGSTAPIVLGGGYGIEISGSYFEANKTSIKFIKGAGTTRLSGKIDTCTFGNTRSDYDIEFDGFSPSVPFFDILNNTSDVPVGKFLTNLTNLYREYENNNLFAGGALAPVTSFRYKKEKTYPFTQNNKGAEGIEYEVPLNMNNSGSLSNQSSKQFLVNAGFTIGSSIFYTAHVTGILSLDGFYDNGTTTYAVNFSELSERNTSGNVNGNLENAANYDYYFKETGTKKISPSVTTATLVFKFPKGVYSTGNTNKIVVKSLTDILMETYINA